MLLSIKDCESAKSMNLVLNTSLFKATIHVAIFALGDGNGN